jgi:hypothetical protein
MRVASLEIGVRAADDLVAVVNPVGVTNAGAVEGPQVLHPVPGIPEEGMRIMVTPVGNGVGKPDDVAPVVEAEGAAVLPARQGSEVGDGRWELARFQAFEPGPIRANGFSGLRTPRGPMSAMDQAVERKHVSPP